MIMSMTDSLVKDSLIQMLLFPLVFLWSMFVSNLHKKFAQTKLAILCFCVLIMGSANKTLPLS